MSRSELPWLAGGVRGGVWRTPAELVPCSHPLPSTLNSESSLESRDRGVGSRVFKNSVFFFDIKKYLYSKYRFDPRTGPRVVRNNLLQLVKMRVVKLHLALCCWEFESLEIVRARRSKGLHAKAKVL